MIAALHPRLWGVHALGLAAVAAAVILGIWQWNVGDGRKSTQSHEYAHAAPAPLASVIAPGASFPASEFGRPVRVTGQWVPSSTVFVHAGSGYWVATAVRSGDSSIYVVRGATDRPEDRSWVGSPLTADVVGWLQPDQSSIDPAQGRVLPVMSNGLTAAFASTPLLDAYVVASAPPGWMTAVPEPTLPKADFWTGLRNWLYAIEWWFFACFAAFIWSRQVRDMTATPVPSES
ncbi:hypothetical protein Back2_16490 [Nocardioides baekrokdamisoli]|uniref:SURF1-like protein n=1 Tax=Nocardioides baekrokdamisoli TaxID=1804624 RepID=A0A3G9IGG7_9ACTN|nr:SURF1 family cytochrome oxidase biogenesis protein [Nocardioides baekrokdamisoli]BBH17362.1 hypothetical protein Back2_16490 [Nocardioides baekrokdamisoli]